MQIFIQYDCEVIWGPFVVRRVSTLENVLRMAMHFIIGLKSGESIGDAREILKLEILESKMKNF